MVVGVIVEVVMAVMTLVMQSDGQKDVSKDSDRLTAEQKRTTTKLKGKTQEDTRSRK